jgi:hypothetical protein
MRSAYFENASQEREHATPSLTDQLIGRYRKPIMSPGNMANTGRRMMRDMHLRKTVVVKHARYHATNCCDGKFVCILQIKSKQIYRSKYKPKRKLIL